MFGFFLESVCGNLIYIHCTLCPALIPLLGSGLIGNRNQGKFIGLQFTRGDLIQVLLLKKHYTHLLEFRVLCLPPYSSCATRCALFYECPASKGLANTILQLHLVAAPASIRNYLTLHQATFIVNNKRF